MSEKKEVKRPKVTFKEIPFTEDPILLNVDVEELKAVIDCSSLTEEQKRFGQRELQRNPTFKRWMWNQHLHLLSWKEVVIIDHEKECKKIHESATKLADAIITHQSKPTYKQWLLSKRNKETTTL